MRRAVCLLAVVLALLPAAALPAGARPGPFRPGAPGIGDPYFPLAGNGGYDVRHYGLDIRYTPATDVLAGTATITARATQDLSAFNLDFDGLTLRSLTVDGRAAAWRRADGELTVTPRQGLRKGRAFTVVARYDGVPEPVPHPILTSSGVFATDDGMVIVGQPEVASTWFPVNDHPRDKASFTTRITAPQGLESLSNGVLVGSSTRHGWTTTTWHAQEPMAPYLATATIGEYQVTKSRKAGVTYWDALDPKLFAPPATPRTGSRLAFTQEGGPSYKRLARTIDVPAGGAKLSFHVIRDTVPEWEFFFVEARTAGADDWTTLPDANGHTGRAAYGICAYGPQTHPFLTHYLTPDPDGICAPQGSTGSWSAASGRSAGYEEWSIDLSAYAGRRLEVSLSSVNDAFSTSAGAFVDDVVVSTGQGTTSFEDDGDALDGWLPGGPPPGSPANPNTWTVSTVDGLPPSRGDRASAALAREPEIIAFLSGTFGPYPFSAAGGIVDSTDAFTFALENQTRPVYAQSFFDTPDAAGVVVHELAHQWYGDSLALARWQDIWLNEGFASYAVWLWDEREKLGTAQETFDSLYQSFSDPEFWALPIGDPGPQRLFDIAVYVRGAMTLHALRTAVGDRAFFTILRTWASTRRGGSVTTPEFIGLAERISGRSLDALFQAWLFGTTRPEVATPPAAAATAPRFAVPSPLTDRRLRHGAARSR